MWKKYNSDSNRNTELYDRYKNTASKLDYEYERMFGNKRTHNIINHALNVNRRDYSKPCNFSIIVINTFR